MTEIRPEGWVHRGPRPLLLWLGVALAVVAIIGVAAFLYRIGNAIALSYEHAATNGQAVPDMSGGLPALITAIVGFLSMVMPQVLNALTARNRQRIEEVRRGTAPPPFASSPPEGGPRPQEDIPP